LYWRVQGALIEKGVIIAGRGKGGSVRLSETEVGPDRKTPVVGSTYGKDKDSYEPLKAAIEKKWINRFGFDQVLVSKTAFQGSRDTGGTFTRPDITAAGVRRYVYLPKRLEVVTFEVKSAEAVNIMAVLEAIAHREAAHRSYVIYTTSHAKFEGATEADRIVELAQKYGIGIVLAEGPDNVESWEILFDAIRNEPDPARLDRFLGDLPDENMNEQAVLSHHPAHAARARANPGNAQSRP